MFRHQLPVRSPISFASLLDGMGTCIFRHGEREREKVKTLVRDHYDPIDVLLTDSGTSALTLAILGACRWKGRKLVALPAYSCYDVATAADGADVEVVLYDLDPKTLGPEVESVRAALERKPAAVLIAYLHGIPVDLDALLPLLEEYDVALIEDGAQGHGASFKGQNLGAIGSLSVLSFGRGKGMTGGSGGALLVNDEVGIKMVGTAPDELDSAELGLKNLFGITAQWTLGRPALYGIPASLPFLKLGETIYKEPHDPAELCDTAAATLARNWSLAAEEAEIRRTNSAELLEMISDFNGLETPSIPPNSEAGYIRFPVIVAEQLRHALTVGAARKLGVMHGYPKRLACLSGFTLRCVNADDVFPGAETLQKRLFTLPTHSLVSRKDIAGLHRFLLAAGQAD